MNRNNKDLQAYARKCGVYFYEIAEAMGISEFTLVRRLRKEVAAEDKLELYEIIDCISAGKREEA